MNEKKDSTDNARNPEEELIKALTEDARERLAARGILVSVINEDGSSKYLIRSGFNRLSTKNCRRQD